MMKIHRIIVFLLFAGLLAGVCYAGVRKEIHFSPGSASATIEGAAIRGERDVYYITAKAGQTPEVRISAVENNAVFAIFKPGSVATEKDGFTEITGEAMPKAGEADDTQTWIGTLPVTGKYLIVVGGTRGNATYKLSVTIH
jgi:hypothetical protein